MKLDIKSILILILLGLTLLFGFKWFFSGDKASKERVKQLEQQLQEITSKFDETNRIIIDLNIQKSKLQ